MRRSPLDFIEEKIMSTSVGVSLASSTAQGGEEEEEEEEEEERVSQWGGSAGAARGGVGRTRPSREGAGARTGAVARELGKARVVQVGPIAQPVRKRRERSEDIEQGGGHYRPRAGRSAGRVEFRGRIKKEILYFCSGTAEEKESTAASSLAGALMGRGEGEASRCSHGEGRGRQQLLA